MTPDDLILEAERGNFLHVNDQDGGIFSEKYNQAIVNMVKRLRVYEAALKSADRHWFDPLTEQYACVGCDLHCSRPELGHDPDCHINIAHEALKHE